MNVCAVIPAAGKGSRLGLGYSKLFTRVADGITVWSILVKNLKGIVDNIHVVLSPDDVKTFQKMLDKNPPGIPISVSIQSTPTGTGPAVFSGYPVWKKSEKILVVWGDQISLSRRTILNAIEMHDNKKKQIVIPLIQSKSPYVEYRFDAAEQLLEIRQSREGDTCMNDGLADVGVFVLSTRGLRNEWIEYLNSSALKTKCGSLTKEINFLPFLVFLANREWNIKRLYVSDPIQARGINTMKDLEFFSNIFKGVPV